MLAICSSAFSKPSLCIWKFSVHILLKPNLKDFEHHFTSMWNEHNYMLVWTFFGIALLWDWNENWPFPVLWPLLSFPDLLTYWVFSSVQSLSRVQLFATLWIAARQASVSITKSRSLLKPMSTESVMPSSHLILCCPLLLLPPTPSVALVNIAFSLLRNIPSLQRIISISVWMHISAWSIVPYLAWKTLTALLFQWWFICGLSSKQKYKDLCPSDFRNTQSCWPFLNLWRKKEYWIEGRGRVGVRTHREKFSVDHCEFQIWPSRRL